MQDRTEIWDTEQNEMITQQHTPNRRSELCTMPPMPLSYVMTLWVFCTATKAEVLNKEAIYLSYVSLLQMIKCATLVDTTQPFTFFFVLPSWWCCHLHIFRHFVYHSVCLCGGCRKNVEPHLDCIKVLEYQKNCDTFAMRNISIKNPLSTEIAQLIS